MSGTQWFFFIFWVINSRRQEAGSAGRGDAGGPPPAWVFWGRSPRGSETMGPEGEWDCVRSNLDYCPCTCPKTAEIETLASLVVD